MNHRLFGAVESAAIIVDPKACWTEYYMKPFFQIVVPRPHNTSFIYCTRDAGLYADYMAHGFCHMMEHSPTVVFSSPAWYDCPDLNPDAVRFNKAVLLSLLMVGLPCLAALGFLLGAAHLAWQIRVDVMARTRLFPEATWHRTVLICGMGLAAAVLALPWLAQWLLAVTWACTAVFVKGVFDFNMCCTLKPGFFDFWKPFRPAGRSIRTWMGGREREDKDDRKWQWEGVDPTIWIEEFAGKEMPPYMPSSVESVEEGGYKIRIITRSNTL